MLRDFGDIDEALAEFRAAIRCARRAGDDERGADVRAAYGVALVHGRTPARAGARSSGPPPAPAGGGRADPDPLGACPVAARPQRRHAPGGAARRRPAQPAPATWSGRRGRSATAPWPTSRSAPWPGPTRTTPGPRSCSPRAGQRLEYASALHDRATTAFARGDLPAALTLLDDAQQVVDELDVFEPELDVTRVQVLLAAELHRDALRVADEAVARSIRLHGSAARRAELLFAAALAASASGDAATAASRSAEALRMFRHQRRVWWAARAELVLLESRFDTGDTSAALLRAATRLAEALESLDVTRVPEARLLCGRLALARGRRSTGILHLRAAAARRPRDVRARSTGWLARAVLADVEGRSGDMLTACARGLDLIDAHLGTLGATELRAQATAQGDDLARLAMGHAARTGDAGRLLDVERALAGHLPRRSAGSARRRPRADPGPRGPAGAGPATGRRAMPPAAPAVRREQRRLEEAVRRRALHRPGAGSGAGSGAGPGRRAARPAR